MSFSSGLVNIFSVSLTSMSLPSQKKAVRVATRTQLLDEVWSQQYYGDTRTLDVHIRRLRAKLGACGDCIETVVGVGYRFVGCPAKGEPPGGPAPEP